MVASPHSVRKRLHVEQNISECGVLKLKPVSQYLSASMLANDSKCPALLPQSWKYVVTCETPDVSTLELRHSEAGQYLRCPGDKLTSDRDAAVIVNAREQLLGIVFSLVEIGRKDEFCLSSRELLDSFFVQSPPRKNRNSCELYLDNQ